VNERPNPWPQSNYQNHRSTSSLIAPLPARSLVSPARRPRDRLANTVNGYGTRSVAEFDIDDAPGIELLTAA
jgi:hypothetical protein